MGAAPHPRLVRLVRMVRPALSPTAAADVLAAAAFAGGAAAGDLALAIAGSICLYAGGMAQNDLCDRERDESLHPGRPLIVDPGLYRGALAMVALLMGCGVVLGALAGALLPALAVALLASAYNFGLKKRFPFDALTLGAVRVANLWIGFHIAGAALTGGTLLYSLGYLLWIGGITAASRCEDAETVQTRRLGLILAWFLKLAALILLACLAESAARSAAFLLPLALLTFFLVRTVRDGSREGVMLYILRCLQLIILVHATTLWARGLTGAVIAQLVCAALSFFLLGALARKRTPAEG